MDFSGSLHKHSRNQRTAHDYELHGGNRYIGPLSPRSAIPSQGGHGHQDHANRIRER